MGTFRRILRLSAVTVGLLAGGSGVAQAAPASLQGTVFLAGPDSGVSGDTSLHEVTLRCGGTAPSHWTYTSSGTATGPYPGAFTEMGNVSIDANGLGDTAPVLTLESNFVIQSGSDVVSGTRTLKLSPENSGSCLAAADRYDATFTATASYAATIETASGSFSDSGTSTINSRRSERFDLGSGQSLGGISRFRADFTSTGGPTDPTPNPGIRAVGMGLLGGFKNPVVFGFYAKQTASGYRGLCGVFDASRKTHITCTSVDSFVTTDGRAVITGEAYVKSVKTRYRIEASDSGRMWGGDSFKITTDNGYSASGSVGLLGGIKVS